MITLYTRVDCSQCKMTKRLLKERKIDYKEIDVDKHPEVIQSLVDRGYRQLPVVVTDKETWGGFRPDKIKAIPVV